MTDGIPAYDLARDVTAQATRSLAALIEAQAKAYSPLRCGLSPAAMEANHRRAEEANRQRERQVSVALGVALVGWEATRLALAGNPAALVVLDIHRPERGYRGVGCAECRESDLDDTAPVEWPCPTFAAIEQAGRLAANG